MGDRIIGFEKIFFEVFQVIFQVLMIFIHGLLVSHVHVPDPVCRPVQYFPKRFLYPFVIMVIFEKERIAVIDDIRKYGPVPDQICLFRPQQFIVGYRHAIHGCLDIFL